MNRKTAKEILADSLRELAQTKSIEKITIREITENCGYSPATFYRHFRDKYDLVVWDYVTHMEQDVFRTGDAVSWHDIFLASTRGHWEHRVYLANLFEHTSGIDSFEKNMMESDFRLMRDRILGPGADPILEQCLMVYCAGCIRHTIEWIQGKFEATPEQMTDILEKSRPALLAPLFER